MNKEYRENSIPLMLIYHRVRSQQQVQQRKHKAKYLINTEWAAKENKASRKYKWLREVKLGSNLNLQLHRRIEITTVKTQRLNISITTYSSLSGKNWIK